MAMKAARYRCVLTVEPGDIDFVGLANNAIYLNWVQDAAVARWRRIAGREAVAAPVWVALKHEITYRKPAFVDDRIIATAVLKKVRRESAFYETVIRRGHEVLAMVKSRWVCLGANPVRPTRAGGDSLRHGLGSIRQAA